MEIEWQFGRPPDLHLASLTENAYDIFEFSLSNFMITRDQPAERKRLQWTALPIFLTKATFAGASTVRLLFQPGAAALVMNEYRRQTGMTPTNHVLIVQQQLVDSHPELALQLYNAFETSKQEAYKRALRSAAGYLLFAKDVFAQQASVFGDDPFPSGLAANRNMLSTLARESFAEGLVGTMPDIDVLFCEALRST